MSEPLSENYPQPLSGLESLHVLMTQQRATIGIGQTLDIRLIEAERGRVLFESIPDQRFYNTLGSAHGGYIATLLDTACGGATRSMLAANQTYATVELKISYHRPVLVETGAVRALGTILNFGRRISFTEAKLTDLEGRLFASATSTLIVTTL